MNEHYQSYWKLNAQSKSNNALHHFQYCALKALFAKSNAKKEILEALLRRAFTPKHGSDWSIVGRLANEAFYNNKIFGYDKSLFFKDEAEERRYKDLVYSIKGSHIAANEPDYMFIFVRQDISQEQQAVQAAHATFCAGFMFPKNYDPTKVNFVLVGVEDEVALDEAVAKLEFKDKEYVEFREPDLGNTRTAIASQVMKESQKRFLKGYKKLEFTKQV